MRYHEWLIQLSAKKAFPFASPSQGNSSPRTLRHYFSPKILVCYRKRFQKMCKQDFFSQKLEICGFCSAVFISSLS